MTSQENEFSASRLMYPCPNPGQSSHESVDSGCCDSEGPLNTCSKTFDAFSLLASTNPRAHQQQQQQQQQHQAAFPSLKRTMPAKQRTVSSRKEDSSSTNGNLKEGTQNGTNGGASYKYLTWREKDRRRRFREEWKHQWLVVPHGMYEVMCLVCHKIMTQRKLDTIKRHTMRRHADLLSMSDAERQRLYHELVSQYFRRGGDLSAESDPFLVNSVPRLRATGPRADVRKHPRLPADVPPSAFRPRVGAPRRFDVDKNSVVSANLTSESIFNSIKPPAPLIPPVNFKNLENFLSNGQLQSAVAKYLMGFPPSQLPPRSKLESSAPSQWKRNLLQHTCGMGSSHAFQAFRKIPPPPLTQRTPLEAYGDPVNNKAPLDMSTSTGTSPMQLSPNDLSMKKCSISSPDSGASLTERLMRLVSTWDTAAVNSRGGPLLFPPPSQLPPPPPSVLMPPPPPLDGAALMLNR